MVERTGTGPALPNSDAVYSPLFGQVPVRVSIRAQPADDETRTADTIAVMCDYAVADSTSPIVRRAALAAIRDLPRRDARREAERIWDWIRRHVRFIEDRKFAGLLEGVEPDEAEVLVRPVDILTMPQPAGDCDDFAMLTAAMLRALGIPARFRTIAGDDAHDYSHVFVVAELADGELALDASHGPYPGWQAASRGKTRDWSIEPMSTRLGAIDWGGLLSGSVETASDILTARYGQPPAGVYKQEGQSIYYRQPEGSTPYSFPGGSFGLTQLSSGTLALIVASVIGLALVFQAIRQR